MYGSIFRMKAIAGKEQEVVDVFDAWDKDRRPNIDGAVGGHLMRLDADSSEFIGVAVFESKEAYLANGNDPAQGEWYSKLRALLTADPEWNDGEYVISM